MARGVNKVILIGNLGADPEMKYMTSGTAIANLSLATNESWNDKTTGEKVEKTEWHRISFFGKPAEIIGEYAKKGSVLYVEGSISTRKWQDSDGNDKYSTEIKGREFQFLGGNENGAGRTTAPAQAQAAAEPAVAEAAGPTLDDDIPF